MPLESKGGSIKFNNVSAVENALLMTGIIRPDIQMPTSEAVQARKVLQSLQDYQPTKLSSGNTALKNPVTETFGVLQPTDKGLSVSFSTENTLERPEKPRNKVQQLGVRATVNQLVDQIPTARNNPDNLDARYTFTPIQDTKDLKRDVDRGKPLGTTNQRAAAYERMTKGAFSAYPNKNIGEWVGHGERIDQTRWQPRQSTGKYGKYVNFDPIEPVKQLGKFAAQSGAIRFVPYGRQLQAAVTAVDYLNQATKALTGKTIKEAGKEAEQTKNKLRKEGLSEYGLRKRSRTGSKRF